MTEQAKYQAIADFFLDREAEQVELEAIKKAEEQAQSDLIKEASRWNY